MSAITLLLLLGSLQTALAASDSGLTQAQKDSLVKQHNACRQAANAKHGFAVKDVVWNEALAKVAQKHIDDFSGSDLQGVQHRSDRDKCLAEGFKCESLGENIAAGEGTDYTTISAEKAAQIKDERVSNVVNEKKHGWCGEEEPFYDDAAKNCNGGECGHFTQVVWDATTEIGCGAKLNYDGNAYTWAVVCNYNPTGNLNGKNPYDPKRDSWGKTAVCNFHFKDICPNGGSGGGSTQPQQNSGQPQQDNGNAGSGGDSWETDNGDMDNTMEEMQNQMQQRMQDRMNAMMQNGGGSWSGGGGWQMQDDGNGMHMSRWEAK